MRQLNNLELMDLLPDRIRKRFGGIHMRDDPGVPWKPNTPMIWNLGSRRGSGTHWVGVWTGSKKHPSLYFDPFGEDPPREIRNFLRGRAGDNIKILSSTTPIQHPRSSSCGWYVLLALEYLARVGPPRRARQFAKLTTETFGPNSRKNEQKLREIWESKIK